MTANVAASAEIPEGLSRSAHLFSVINPRLIPSYPVVRLYEAARGTEIHRVIPNPHITFASSLIPRYQTRLGNLTRQCGDLLSTVREHSPGLVGTVAGAEADEGERYLSLSCILDTTCTYSPREIERILNRVLVWAGYSERTFFLKQNEIQLGIEECYRELSACSNNFMVNPLFHSTFHETSCLSFQPSLRSHCLW